MNSTIIVLLFIIGFVFSLRIKFSTDFIDAEPTRSCRNVGDVYYRGVNNASTSCEATDSASVASIPLVDCIGFCASQDVIQQDYIYQLQNVTLPWLTDRLQSLFYVPPAYQSSIWKIPSSVQRCGFKTNDGFAIPASWQTDGLNDTDLVIVVLMRPMPLSVYSQGLYCVRDSVNQRPILGILNIPAPMMIGQSSTTRNYLLQQCMHILGFHYPILSSIYNPSTKSATVNGAMRTTNTLILPQTSNALQKLQAHTKCTTMTSIEMEDLQLPLKTHLWTAITDPNSYLEKRFFFNELMTSDLTTNPLDGPVLSPITLGIMEDLSWYKANYSAADKYIWGKDTGCMLQDQQCQNWVPDSTDSTSRLNWYFCDTVQSSSYCTVDLNSKGNCDVVKYSSTISPAYYQHFTDNTVGGTALLNDYCPVVKRLSSGDCRVASNGVYNEKTAELYNATSKCFMSTLVLQTSSTTPGSSTSTCLPTACGPLAPNTTDIYLFVKIGQYWTQCARTGGEQVSISLYAGSLYCPPYDTICTDGVVSSNFNFDIADKSKNSAPTPWYVLC
jgi:hypothetical protein